MSEYLLDKLKSYSEEDFYPLHMPGHKRCGCGMGDPFAIDITEIEGFDNLHHAQGVLLEAQRRAAALYGADETYYLVNGSTCGILAAVSACARRGGRILMARNCHKAAYHAVLLNGLRPVYLYPETDGVYGINGSITPEAVREALAEQAKHRPDTPVEQAEYRPEAPADMPVVLITSPTYDGVVSDIRRIAAEVHRAGGLLIVDEAHGAHFAMHPYFPDSALACGADIVINSLHKTMPSLTQTALLHVRGPRVDRERLQKYLGIYQSSSPSYVLMAGMDECVRQMQVKRRELFDAFTERLEGLRKKLRQLKVLHLVEGKELPAFAFDTSKVLIAVRKKEAFADGRAVMNGPQLAQLLRERYHLEVEMETEYYVTAILTACDTQEGFERLQNALFEIDGELAREQAKMKKRPRAETGMWPGDEPEKTVSDSESGRTSAGAASQNGQILAAAAFDICPEAVLTLQEAEDAPREQIALMGSAGRISLEFVYLYPPGIPLLVPGERIAEDMPARFAGYRKTGLSLQGLSDYSGQKIFVVRGERVD